MVLNSGCVGCGGSQSIAYPKNNSDGGFLDRTGQGMVIPLHVSSAAPTVPPATTPGGSVPIHISLLTKGISKFADDDENSVSDVSCLL